MKFEIFLTHFRITSDRGGGIPDRICDNVDSDFIEVINNLGGKSFEDGLYRIYQGVEIKSATEMMLRVFPELGDRITVFSYDWLGRHFAIDRGRSDSGKPLVLMLEPGAGEVMQIPVTITEFHEEELVAYSADALSVPFYMKWKETVKEEVQIPATKCIGYKIPLFLGGGDTVNNLELVDMSVYIEICGQLRNKTKTLDDGQTISDVAMGD